MYLYSCITSQSDFYLLMMLFASNKFKSPAMILTFVEVLEKKFMCVYYV